MAKSKRVTLVGPDGREYSTTDRSEVTNLKARGYRVKADKPAAQTQQQQPKPASK